MHRLNILLLGALAVVPRVVVFHEADTLALDGVRNDADRMPENSFAIVSLETMSFMSWPLTSRTFQPKAFHLSSSGVSGRISSSEPQL